MAICSEGSTCCDMELASFVGMVCALHLCSVCTPGPSGWHRLPIGTRVKENGSGC